MEAVVDSKCAVVPFERPLRAADLHRAAKLGNPEQDCFARFVHETTAALVYPFNALERNLDTLALNHSTLARLGEPRNMEFNCICQTGQTCSPWFLHFMQATNRHSSSPIASNFILTSHPHLSHPQATRTHAILTTWLYSPHGYTFNGPGHQVAGGHRARAVRQGDLGRSRS